MTSNRTLIFYWALFSHRGCWRICLIVCLRDNFLARECNRLSRKASSHLQTHKLKKKKKKFHQGKRRASSKLVEREKLLLIVADLPIFFKVIRQELQTERLFWDLCDQQGIWGRVDHVLIELVEPVSPVRIYIVLFLVFCYQLILSELFHINRAIVRVENLFLFKCAE